jgi:hypothetical protein
MSGARAAFDYFNVPDVEKRVAEHSERKKQRPQGGSSPSSRGRPS